MNSQHHSRSAVAESHRGPYRVLLAFVVLAITASSTLANDFCLFPEFRLDQEDQSCCIDDAVITSCCKANSAGKDSILDPFLPRFDIGLPFMSEQAEARGFTLPLPLGASFISTELNRTVGVSDLRVGVGGNPPESVEHFDVGNLKAHASSQMARLDAWVFPFLNVYGFAGHTKSTGAIEATIHDFPSPGDPSVSIPVNINLTGPT